jgi:acetyl-CoA C-acetyltransferase
MKILKRTLSTIRDNDAVVLSFARTPIGKLGGALAGITAPKLGAHAIKHALTRSKINTSLIEEAFMGNNKISS